jgi:hypothetical protein
MKMDLLRYEKGSETTIACRPAVKTTGFDELGRPQRYRRIGTLLRQVKQNIWLWPVFSCNPAQL